MLIKRQEKILYKDWLYIWLNERKNYIKESPYANYTNIVYNHIIPKLGNYKLTDLTNQIMQNFLLELFNNGRLDNKGGLSEKSIKDIATVLKLSLKRAIYFNKIDNIYFDFVYPKREYKKIVTLKQNKKG